MLCDSARRRLWHFQILRTEGHEEFNGNTLDEILSVCGIRLALVDKGVIKPTSLQKHLSQQQPAVQIAIGSRTSAFDQPPRNTSQNNFPSLQDQESQLSELSGAELETASQFERTAYENFMTAILVSLSSAFCARTGAIPLNYRTILLSSAPQKVNNLHESQATQCPVLATLKAYCTTTGSLLISFAVSRCKGLSSLADFAGRNFPSSTAPYLAAPFGVVANNQGFSMGEAGTASLAQTPNTQTPSARVGRHFCNSLWKKTCLSILKLRGVTTSQLGDCNWVNLEIPKPWVQDSKSESKRAPGPGSTVTILWPGPLCFRKKTVEVSSTSRVGDTLFSGHVENHDPLDTAKGWFASSSDREEKISKRKTDRALATKEAPATESRVVKPRAPSPVALRRPSMAAACAIYPTPPDGIQNPNGVTPSIDGPMSSPGNPLSAPPATDADQALFNAALVSDAFETGPDANDPKQQRSESNLLGDPDHVFSDIGGNMFGDHDITEADFNFFDEQPEDLDLDVPMADVLTGDATATTGQDATASASQSKSAAPPERDMAVFVKPELRLARGSEVEASGPRGTDTRSGSLKREPSPFDPGAIFKRMRASPAVTGHSQGSEALPATRTTRVFDPMRFDPSLPMINKKYEIGGQFDYRKLTSMWRTKIEPGTLPETDYLKRNVKLSKKTRDRHFNPEFLIRGLTGLDPSASHSSPAKIEGSVSEYYDSSIVSDEDDSSYTTEEPISPLKSNVKPLALDDDAASPVASLREFELVEELDQQLAMELPWLAKPESRELPLSLLFSDPEPLALELSLDDEELIQVAQILTNQAGTGSLDILDEQESTKTLPSTHLFSQTLSMDARNAFVAMREVVPPLLGGATPVSLRELLDISDVSVLGPPARQPPRSLIGKNTNNEAQRRSNLYQIPAPHLEVRRSEAKLSLLPSAVLFWESLGLAPSSGGKNVSAICVFPDWHGMANNAKTFMGRLKSVYEMLKLGSFESIASTAELEDGLLPYRVDRISTSPGATVTGHDSALVESMGIVLEAVSKLHITAANIVVYLLYSPNNPGTVVEACVAFQHLIDSHRKTIRHEAAPSELVLQLVSTSLLSSPTAVVVTPGPELTKICMQTYDRCIMFDGPMPSPAIKLEQPLPRIIDFKLTASPSASLIRENSCIHVAYAQSVDERWITAAWTDDRGDQQETASYCLGRKGQRPSRSTHEVAQEIWESTLDLISVWKVYWRVIITKCGPMGQQEIDLWAGLARMETKASVGMTLITVDTNPSLQLIPPLVKLPQPPALFYTTPVSTPQASIVSPEQSGTPATPSRDANAVGATPGAEGGGDSEYEAVLSDVTDQTWAAVVGHRLNSSWSAVKAHTALASGYLIKRTGTRIEDAPVLMEVNLAYSDNGSRPYESVLRELLSSFRGLGTLARARGVVQRETDVRPWHVAAAEKAVRTLYLLM